MKTYEGDLRKKWGHPADYKHQRNSSCKSRDNKIKKRDPTNTQQNKREKVIKVSAFSNKHSISEPSPSIRAKIPDSIRI